MGGAFSTRAKRGRPRERAPAIQRFGFHGHDAVEARIGEILAAEAAAESVDRFARARNDDDKAQWPAGAAFTTFDRLSFRR